MSSPLSSSRNILNYSPKNPPLPLKIFYSPLASENSKVLSATLNPGWERHYSMNYHKHIAKIANIAKSFANSYVERENLSQIDCYLLVY